MGNEVRLIDANVLLQKISRMLDYCQDNKLEDEMSALFQVGDAIIDCPTIDPESLRPKGRWELNGNDDDCRCSYFCSNCHRSYPEEWFYDHGRYVPFENCPHCTAKMEG